MILRGLLNVAVAIETVGVAIFRHGDQKQCFALIVWESYWNVKISFWTQLYRASSSSLSRNVDLDGIELFQCPHERVGHLLRCMGSSHLWLKALHYISTASKHLETLCATYYSLTDHIWWPLSSNTTMILWNT